MVVFPEPCAVWGYPILRRRKDPSEIDKKKKKVCVWVGEKWRMREKVT